jgi:hypothetical protein
MKKSTPRDVEGLTDIVPDPFAEQFAQQYHASPKESEQQITAMVTPTWKTH